MNLPPNKQMPVKFGNFAEQYLHWFSTNHIQTKFNALFRADGFLLTGLRYLVCY